MAREHETTTAAQQQSWGTLEELLLACAVNRHGTKSWDLIAMEVRTRSSTLSPLTPQSCKDKFDDLRRRFGFAATSQHDAESGGGFLVSMVDQLTRIRVQELRAEVERHDISIVSLELKVKRLEEKEERETSLKADTDLEREKKASPEIIAGKFSAAEANSDDRDNRSFHESNSTTQKAETTTTKIQNDTILDKEDKEHRVKPESEAETEPVSGEPGRDRDWSFNGILNRTGNVKDDNENDKTTSDGKTGSDDENKRSGAGGLSESNELWDESKGEGKEAGLRVAAAASKQNSDVQSSASLSKTIQRRRSEGGGGGGAAGCSSSEEVSPATRKVLAVKSEPLVRLLAMIRSHRLGSHFERRLRSQESERYKKLVKQHIDLRTIQSRLDRGLYSNCIQRFYRDLLLLFNNFIVFFKKTSQEHGAARELRATVIKEMADKLEKPKPKPKSELPPISLSKPSKGSTMVVCGKRSSVKAMTENASKKRGDKKEKEVEEKEKEKESPKVNEKKLGSEDKGVMKKRSNESKNSRGGSSNNNNNKGDGEVIKHPYGNNELSSHDGNNVKLDKKEISVRKKQGAASFLRRMKQNSPKKVAEKNGENKKEKEKEKEVEDEDDDDDDDNDSESKDSRVEEDGMKKRRGRNNSSNNNNNNSSSSNKNNKKKRDGRKERVTRSNSNWKGREENGRKGVGRPTKRSTGARKRGRENGESEVGAVGKRTRR